MPTPPVFLDRPWGSLDPFGVAAPPRHDRRTGPPLAAAVGAIVALAARRARESGELEALRAAVADALEADTASGHAGTQAGEAGPSLAVLFGLTPR